MATYGVTRGDSTALGPAGPRAVECGQGAAVSQVKHAEAAVWGWWGIRAVPYGASGPGEARTVSVRGQGKVRGPGRQSCRARAWLFLRRPAQAIATGTFPGSSGLLPEGALRGTSGPGGGGAAAARCGPRAAAAAAPPHLGRSGPSPPSAGRAGGTMITSAGEGAARGSAARRCFAESGP